MSRLVDNTDEVLFLLAMAQHRALESIGLVAEGHAKKKCPVDTGNLRNSITHKTDDHDVYIGTNNEYAVYVEMGTGIYYPGGRKEPWFYEDETGVRHFTSGSRPQPYLKPAVTEHSSEYKKIIQNELKNAF